MTRLAVIETGRLVLRELTRADAGFIVELLNTPGFLQHIGDRGVRTPEDACRYIDEGPADSYRRNGFGLYCVELRDGGAPIGLCGLVKRDVLPDIDLGYACLPQYWGRGYAIEAAASVLADARSRLGLERIIAIVAPGNAASIRLLEKLGFAYEHRVRLAAGAEEISLYASVPAVAAAPSGAPAIAIESPRQPDVARLIEQLDAYQASLYPPESNHLLDIDTLCQPDIRFFVARLGGEPVGCGALRLDGPGSAEIKRMFVSPRVRGRRLGRAILGRLEQEGRALGLAWLRLETGIHQDEALALYRNAGYVEREPFGEYQPDPLSLFLEKRLDGGA